MPLLRSWIGRLLLRRSLGSWQYARANRFTVSAAISICFIATERRTRTRA